VRSFTTFVNVLAFTLALATVRLEAQWPEVKTKRVPLTRDGKPNLTAPAPKLADGKTPDLSGIWNSIKTPCEASATARIFGCSDIPLGVSIGLFDVTANGSEEGKAEQPRPCPISHGPKRWSSSAWPMSARTIPPHAVCRSRPSGSGPTSFHKRSYRPGTRWSS